MDLNYTTLILILNTFENAGMVVQILVERKYIARGNGCGAISIWDQRAFIYYLFMFI